MKNIIITIFGATGFIGSQIVRDLANQGYILRLAEKHPKKADRLKFNGMVGQIQPIACDYSAKDIENAIDGATYVVNTIGIIAEKGHRSFMDTHCYLPEKIAKACAKNNVKQLIHISALGVETNKSNYAKSKLAGEKLICKNFENITILRPSVVFGYEDNFFNMFAKIAQISPFLPLIGGGKTKFQPVYVGDVADAVTQAIKQKAYGIYELGGPEVLNFKELLQKMLRYTGQKVKLIVLPYWAAKIQAVLMSILPNPPITLDQIKSLKHNNIVSDNAKTLPDLSVKPTSMDAILPNYLERYR